MSKLCAGEVVVIGDSFWEPEKSVLKSGKASEKEQSERPLKSDCKEC